MVHTDEGVLPFQRYFVYRRCEPRLLGLEFAGLAAAQPSPQVLAALDSASAVILCPSNPYLSLDPILLLPGLAERLRELTVPVVAVSPIIGGQALKGPAAKIMAELGVEASAVAVAKHLAGRIRLDGFVLDTVDANLAGEVAALGITPLVTDTIMRDAASKERLAREVLALVRQHRRQAGSVPSSTARPGFDVTLHIIVPVKQLAEAKSRLAPVLAEEERQALAVALSPRRARRGTARPATARRGRHRRQP